MRTNRRDGGKKGDTRRLSGGMRFFRDSKTTEEVTGLIPRGMGGGLRRGGERFDGDEDGPVL